MVSMPRRPSSWGDDLNDLQINRNPTADAAPPVTDAAALMRPAGGWVQPICDRGTRGSGDRRDRDASAAGSIDVVMIIHGHGTGALRRGLSEFLSAHPLVERTSLEAEDRGGAAITIVELKD